MERRTFLKLAAVIVGAGAVIEGTSASEIKGGCSSSEDKPKKKPGRPYKTGHPGRPLPTHGDDGSRWICDNDREVFFSKAAAQEHKDHHPSHHVRRYK